MTKTIRTTLAVLVVGLGVIPASVDQCMRTGDRGTVGPALADEAGNTDQEGGCCQSCPDNCIGCGCHSMPGLSQSGDAMFAEFISPNMPMEYSSLASDEIASCLFRPPAA